MAGITLEEVTELARELVRSQRKQTAAAAVLMEASARVSMISDVLLPSTLREIDMMKFTLSDGSVISVEPNVSAAISELHWPEAEEWLVKNDRDGIIKNQVITEFDKGQNDFAADYKAVCEELLLRPALLAFVKKLVSEPLVNWDDFKVDREELLGDEDLPAGALKAKKTVHPQTLKAFVRECMKSGLEVPEDLFGVFITDHAKITPPKG